MPSFFLCRNKLPIFTYIYRTRQSIRDRKIRKFLRRTNSSTLNYKHRSRIRKIGVRIYDIITMAIVVFNNSPLNTFQIFSIFSTMRYLSRTIHRSTCFFLNQNTTNKSRMLTTSFLSSKMRIHIHICRTTKPIIRRSGIC